MTNTENMKSVQLTSRSL